MNDINPAIYALITLKEFYDVDSPQYRRLAFLWNRVIDWYL